MTLFKDVYNCFLGKITDDMYMEWTQEDTYKDMQSILLNSIPNFEFPRFNLYDYTVSEDGEDFFQDDLTSEEINILANLMVCNWLQRQISSVENIRMKYSGSDFKMTSQANHLSKLITLKTELEKQDKHYQRLYKRRTRDKNGKIISNWSSLLGDRVIE